ncbi:MAG: hypothetical protein IPJ30_14500 [Acidobacteria bacterium]|nr:hypothetical protein [Acidobacteriota bacterium]
MVRGNDSMKLIRTDGATPGKGRNIGIAASRNEWVALTDAGIRLEASWLEELSRKSEEELSFSKGGSLPAIVYGIMLRS